jgi:hypothetical protein
MPARRTQAFIVSPAQQNLFLSGIKRRRAGASKFRVPGIR